MRKHLTGLMVAVVLLIAAAALPAAADDLDQGRSLMRQGQLDAAAQFFNSFVLQRPSDKLAPEALALSGRCLDAMADYLSGEAEKRCYWGREKARTPECMQREADALNARYGPGAFQYEHAVLFIFYTGSHYRQLLSAYPKSAYAPEAEFYQLLRQLGGHPDTVIPRINAFLSRAKGEWNRRGQLLLARVNEDVWYVMRKWSWVLFNDQIDQAELIVRAEPYRQAALRAYQQLMKDKGSCEGAAAAQEYARLQATQDDNVVYSIVNDASPGVLSKWCVDAPPQVPAQTRERTPGSSSYQPSALP